MYGPTVTADGLDEARAAMARGDVLVAYDAARAALDDEPDNLEARFIVALVLALCDPGGSRARARRRARRRGRVGAGSRGRRDRPCGPRAHVSPAVAALRAAQHRPGDPRRAHTSYRLALLRSSHRLRRRER